MYKELMKLNSKEKNNLIKNGQKTIVNNVLWVGSNMAD